MRVIKASMLRSFWERHGDAEASLRTWIGQTRAAQWRNFTDLRSTFPSADMVTVASRRSVVVFNVTHNRYRLIAAVHFNMQIVYTLMILTHKEYDRNAWKEQL
ncbi:MAG TPA: type II toxin-antitoxin system HigB family toxin [Tepidisphaeraceae bacterium]|jgi:mRNA interferase HigB